MEGKTILGYTLQRRLGMGGMAEVWYAENVIGKKAAMKILLPKFCVDETVVKRFMTEAKVMVDLNHPNIRQVYDYSEIDDRPAIIMEYLEGDDLKARMKAGQRFTETELEKWWNQLVDALKYTHEEGIVHRDIKPGNIFVDKKGNVKLLDFGIAKVRESISSTQTGQKLGTLMYMSPEQVRDSKHIDYHTDIYSLAVTFVHLLTGKKPYDSDNSSDYDIQTSIVTQPLDLNGVPDGWKGFLAPYLEKEPSKRPELRYFEAVVPERKPIEQPNSDDEETIVESSPKKPEHSENSKKKNKLGLWIGLVVVAIVVAVFMLKPSQPQSFQIDFYAESNSITIFGNFRNTRGDAFLTIGDNEYRIDFIGVGDNPIIGTYSIIGDLITFTNEMNPCKEVEGIYEVEYSKKGIAFICKSDECSKRKTTLLTKWEWLTIDD